MSIPSECDICSFQNVCDSSPIWETFADQFTLTIIRLVNLDSMWVREPVIVATNWRRAHADYLNSWLSIADSLLEDRDKGGRRFRSFGLTLRSAQMIRLVVAICSSRSTRNMTGCPSTCARTFPLAPSEYSCFPFVVLIPIFHRSILIMLSISRLFKG